MRRKTVKRLLAASIALALTTGSVFAAEDSIFDNFYESTEAKLLKQQATQSGVSVNDKGVTMTVDSLVNTGDGAIIAFTMENQTTNPWGQDVVPKWMELKAMQEDGQYGAFDCNYSFGYDVRTSEDGKKQTYLLDITGVGDLAGKSLELSVDAFIRPKDPAYKPISIDVGQILTASAVIPGQRVLTENSTEIHREHYAMLTPGKSVVLDSRYPGITLRGAAIMGSGQSRAEGNEGLVLYIHHDKNTVPESMDNLWIAVSQLVDKTTGTVYEDEGSRFFQDENGNTILAAYFPMIQTVEQAVSLTAAQVQIKIDEKVVPGNWKVNIPAMPGFKGKTAEFSAALTSGEAYTAKVILSSSGLRIKGELQNKDLRPNYYDNFADTAKLYTTTGREITMSRISFMSDAGDFSFGYVAGEPSDSDLIDPATIAAAQIDTVRIEFK